MSEEIRDLSVSGAGSSGGGTYKTVNVSGAYTFTGDVKCVEFKCSGSTTCKGNLNADSFRTSGSTKVTGKVDVKHLGVSGSCKILSGIKAEEIHITGATKVEGDIQTHQLHVSGVFDTTDNIEAERIHITGKLFNKGFINAESIFIEVEAGSEFNEMGATKIELLDSSYEHPIRNVLGSGVKIFLPRKYRSNKITGNLIEGDDVSLENSNIKIIRGKVVNVGPYCLIDEIEYSETLQIHETSTVLRQKKI
ncbi:MAG: hypothetical protein ACRCST_13445 [Turicibacter sp.]